ncbi:hypothetical protein PHL041M10_18 [Propionibacterium phage PHL041M10]|uniref:Uncharacterized protein n=1 Tax=Propionibacterium phage PHL041M10 TaxID=1500801 RepID=A0A0E3DKA3_9CAUD|nr:hypothetical protein ACQ82_gp18 [Propionibacterium phage PHL041M10]AII28734.1 hypothetical protein PHL041M10_18 [Propionibacterium phage PHL041M10]
MWCRGLLLHWWPLFVPRWPRFWVRFRLSHPGLGSVYAGCRLRWMRWKSIRGVCGARCEGLTPGFLTMWSRCIFLICPSF